MRESLKLGGLLLSLVAASMVTNRLVAQPLTFSHFAGTVGGADAVDGPARAARFSSPNAAAFDAGGNLYIADTKNHTIRKMARSGDVTTLAGLAGVPGNSDGAGSAARFNYPTGIAVDGSGNVVVADRTNHTIRKIVVATGVVTTLAGRAGNRGSADGTGSDARFSYPSGVAVDAAGNVFVADEGNKTIRKVTPEGVVTTFAGRAGSDGIVDGTGAAARFSDPRAVAADRAGNIYVADEGNHTIRKITPLAAVTLLAGSRMGMPGSQDGTGTSAGFRYPGGIAVDPAGVLYVADTDNGSIRRVTQDGVVTTLAGSEAFGSVDGTGTAATFARPFGTAVDPDGNVVVTEQGSVLRKVTPGGVVTTIAGLACAYGFDDATGMEARFYSLLGVAASPLGNLYVADSLAATIRKISPDAVVTTLAGKGGVPGSADGPGASARFDTPSGVAVDPAENVYVADSGNHTIRKITPDGVVSTLAGQAGSSGSADGTGGSARFNAPGYLAADSAGNLFVSDTGNNTIRRIDAATRVVTTVAGRAGSFGSTDGAGSSARFSHPQGLAIDTSGNIFVADSVNHTIRRITTTGEVTTVAGKAGSAGTSNGTGTAARFDHPTGVTVDGSGNVWVADMLNHTLRKVTTSGAVTTEAGAAGISGTADGVALWARFYYPVALCFTPAGRLFVADMGNAAIRLGVPPAVLDTATIDAETGPAGQRRQLDSSPRTATNWQWSLIRKPSTSATQLSASDVRNPTFTPDVADLFVFRLTATNGPATAISTVSLMATPDTTNPLLLSDGKVFVRVTWRNQYSGQTGTATGIPKGDSFGFFFFSDPRNPEVFVKVLDFGPAHPFLLFWSGLTDFEYTVTFTNRMTGKTYSATKPAGSAAGGANTTDLPHARAVKWDQETGKALEIGPGEFLGIETEKERLFHRAGDAESPAAAARENASGEPFPEGDMDLLLARGQVSVSVTWRSQYSGETGTATPLPQDDQFGFFYFSSAGNPEVFVKVLDWGADRPFLLFAAGLTDFEYTVTYRNAGTGQRVVFTKPSGGFGGYVDGTSLGH